MDLRQLEILRAVAERGSFTGAGRHLHLSQSAVSRQILLLEDELSEPLFLRIGRKVRITPAGEQLLRLSHRIFNDMDETRAAIRDGQNALTGTLRLMGGMTVCLYVFPALVKEYRRSHPGIEVKVTPGTATRLLRKFRSGAADLALLTLPLDDPNLVTVPVMHEELLLVTAPAHPLASRRRVTPADLVRQPFVLFEAGSNTRRVLDEFFLRENVDPRIVTETENVEIIKAMVRVGLGMSILPYQAVASEVRSGLLFCTRLSGHPLVRETGWVYPRANRVPRMVREMMQTLERLLPKLRLSPRSGPGVTAATKVVPLASAVPASATPIQRP
jgi:DNA-binding transcriptional LysR family regulator